jgi:hypothetical protein
MNIDVKTARKFIKTEDFSPEPPNRAGRPSKLDTYKAVIDKWLTDDKTVGANNAIQPKE